MSTDADILTIPSRILFEHQLRFAPLMVSCPCGKSSPSHTTDHGFCICGWSIWSREGAEEIRAAHLGHLQWMTWKQKRTQQAAVNRERSLHELHWNETQDTGRCSWCSWHLTNSSMAKIMVAFDCHLAEIKDNV